MVVQAGWEGHPGVVCSHLRSSEQNVNCLKVQSSCLLLLLLRVLREGEVTAGRWPSNVPHVPAPGTWDKAGESPSLLGKGCCPRMGTHPTGRRGQSQQGGTEPGGGQGQSMQDVTLQTLTLLLLKHTRPQVLGIPTSLRVRFTAKVEAESPDSSSFNPWEREELKSSNFT